MYVRISVTNETSKSEKQQFYDIVNFSSLIHQR